MQIKTCGFCGKEIAKTRKYCNLSCAGKMRTGKVLRKTKIFRCPCGKEIEVSIHEKRKYCSRSCSATVTNKTHPKRTKKYRKCLHCKTLTSNPKFCKLECFNEVQKSKTLEKFLRGDSLELHKSDLIYDFLLDRQSGGCAICEISPIWNDKLLRFIHDHIDGKSWNNHPDNIRLVCSNCDSQLDTYKAKNVGNGRHSRRIRYAEGKSF